MQVWMGRGDFEDFFGCCITEDGADWSVLCIIIGPIFQLTYNAQ